MRINSNSYVSQIYQNNNCNSTFFENTSSESNSFTDKINISKEGLSMSRMMKPRLSPKKMEAHKSTLQETVKSLDIQNLNVENMSDEDMQKVVASFQDSMSQYMHDDMKQAEDMSTEQLKETITNIKSMSGKLNSNSNNYGSFKGARPAGMGKLGGRMKPPAVSGPPGGVQASKMLLMNSSETEETSESTESELIDTLLEALESEEVESTNSETDESNYEDMTFDTIESMEEVITKLNEIDENI